MPVDRWIPAGRRRRGRLGRRFGRPAAVAVTSITAVVRSPSDAAVPAGTRWSVGERGHPDQADGPELDDDDPFDVGSQRRDDGADGHDGGHRRPPGCRWSRGPQIRKIPRGPSAVTARTTRTSGRRHQQTAVADMDREVDEDEGHDELDDLQHPEAEAIGTARSVTAVGQDADLRRSSSVIGCCSRLGRRDPAGPSTLTCDGGGGVAGAVDGGGRGGLGHGGGGVGGRPRRPSSSPFLNSFWAEPSDRASLGIWVEPNRTSTTTTRTMMPSTPKISAGGPKCTCVSLVELLTTRLDLSVTVRCAAAGRHSGYSAPRAGRMTRLSRPGTRPGTGRPPRPGPPMAPQTARPASMVARWWRKTATPATTTTAILMIEHGLPGRRGVA